ncbi:rod shape-determining protein RodA [Pseudalkalibacillus caeni]|uniref:Rod shape-determining protein RodA n=2 Tax=Exobacillus caeni TaxID=2574798 RepID=A0A5R9EZ58_9BACL|nr:rod shape-determining protein RodA [Pseudalkalibacillus caeni]
MFCVSCISIFSAQTNGQYEDNFLLKQIMWYFVGTVVLVATMIFDLEQLRKLSWYFYGFGNFLLVLLIFTPERFAPTINGAKSWFVVPGAGSLQPSEIVKVCLILVLSNVIVSHNSKIFDKTIKSDLLLILKMLGFTMVPIMLVMMQPDLGTSLVMLAIFAFMLLMSGVAWRLLVLLYSSVALIGFGLILMIIKIPEFVEGTLGVKEYQLGRIYSWLDPENYEGPEAYQLNKALLAIGSGKIYGKGYQDGSVYLPENHTDFIIGNIGEEFGFLGISIVLTLFFLLIYRIIRIALEIDDPFGSFICAGVIAMITFHVFQNVGMAIGLVPITGIPLPFISYGGSSLLGSMFAMGLVFNVKFRTRKYMFSAND